MTFFKSSQIDLISVITFPLKNEPRFEPLWMLSINHDCAHPENDGVGAENSIRSAIADFRRRKLLVEGAVGAEKRSLKELFAGRRTKRNASGSGKESSFPRRRGGSSCRGLEERCRSQATRRK